MRLYRGKVTLIAEDIVTMLVADGDIEVAAEMVDEVQLDVEAVLNEYRRLDREIMEKAKDMIAARGLDYSHTTRVKRRLAEQQGFGIDDKAYDYIITQLLEVVLHTRNIEEVFADDNTMRRKMRDAIRKHAELDDDLDRQVKARIKNLQEGTGNYDIEYERVMGNLRRQKGLET